MSTSKHSGLILVILSIAFSVFVYLSLTHYAQNDIHITPKDINHNVIIQTVNKQNSKLSELSDLLNVVVTVFSGISFFIMGEVISERKERSLHNEGVLKKISELTPTTVVVSGQGSVFREFANLAKDAKESIWAARFSNSTLPSDEKEYLNITRKKICGNGCEAVEYRRLTNLNEPFKYDFAIKQVEDFYERRNFQLKKTTYSSYIDILVIDGALTNGVAAIIFNDTRSTIIVDSVVVTRDQKLVERIRSMYLNIWQDAEFIKDSEPEISKEEIIRELLKSRTSINKGD